MMWAVSWDPWCFFLPPWLVWVSTELLQEWIFMQQKCLVLSAAQRSLKRWFKSKKTDQKNPRRDSLTCQKFLSQCSRGLNVLACPCCCSQMRCKYSWPKQGFRLLTAFAASAIPMFCGFNGNLLPSSCLSLDYSSSCISHCPEQDQSSAVMFSHVFSGWAGWKPQVSPWHLGCASWWGFSWPYWGFMGHNPAFHRVKWAALLIWSRLPRQSFVCGINLFVLYSCCVPKHPSYFRNRPVFCWGWHFPRSKATCDFLVVLFTAQREHHLWEFWFPRNCWWPGEHQRLL